MSNFTKTSAVVDIAAAYVAVHPVGLPAAPAQRTRMAITGLTNDVFGTGHPPRGVPL